jgi:hypothetical protein
MRWPAPGTTDEGSPGDHLVLRGILTEKAHSTTPRRPDSAGVSGWSDGGGSAQTSGGQRCRAPGDCRGDSPLSVCACEFYSVADHQNPWVARRPFKSNHWDSHTVAGITCQTRPLIHEQLRGDRQSGNSMTTLGARSLSDSSRRGTTRLRPHLRKQVVLDVESLVTGPVLEHPRALDRSRVSLGRVERTRTMPTFDRCLRIML